MRCENILPELPSCKPYEKLVDTMKKHYNPEPLEIAEVYLFLHRKQHEGETEYLTYLRRLITTCKTQQKLVL